jgi:Tfp pilus assembly protein PilF
VPFALGLAAKPMLVTFPFTLLLLDVWPLRRVQFPRTVWEKLPLTALSAGASAVTYLVQRSTGAVQAVPLATRIENALISYAVYIGQMFWPTQLSVLYPYPQIIAAWRAVAAFTLFTGMSALAVLAWRRRPYFATGWFWYAGTLVPVIGVVQVGTQSHADRYTYVPLVGLSIIVAWGAAETIGRWPPAKPVIAAAAAVACMASMAAVYTQLRYWENSETLFQHAINTTENNCLAEYNLGHYLMSRPGRNSDAIAHFEAALRINPKYADAHNNLGVCLTNAGRNTDAIPEFEASTRLKPDFADAHFNLALAFSKIPEHAAEAIAQFETALRLNPDLENAHGNLALLLVSLGRAEEAVPHLQAAVRLHPDYRNEHNLGAVLSILPGRQSEAIAHLEASQRLHPDPETPKLIDRLRAGLK